MDIFKCYSSTLESVNFLTENTVGSMCSLQQFINTRIAMTISVMDLWNFLTAVFVCIKGKNDINNWKINFYLCMI